MKVVDRQSLFDWILLRLGSNINNIELYPENVENEIDSAIEFYLTHTGLGVAYEQWLWIDVLDPQNLFLPDNVFSVVDVTTKNQNVATSTYLNRLFYLDFYVGNNRFNMMTYDVFTNELYKQYNATLASRTIIPANYDFTIDKQLRITPCPSIGDKIGVRCFAKIDDETPQLFQHYWIKEYAYALTKLTYGNILTKYSNVVLSGSLTLNGELILSEAKELKAKLEEDFFEIHQSLPVLLVQ